MKKGSSNSVQLSLWRVGYAPTCIFSDILLLSRVVMAYKHEFILKNTLKLFQCDWLAGLFYGTSSSSSAYNPRMFGGREMSAFLKIIRRGHQGGTIQSITTVWPDSDQWQIEQLLCWKMAIFSHSSSYLSSHILTTLNVLFHCFKYSTSSLCINILQVFILHQHWTGRRDVWEIYLAVSGEIPILL